MNDRQPDRYRQQREERLLAYKSSPTLREQFPHVEQLVVQLTFTDHSGMGHYSPRTHTFGPAATAYFHFPCPSSMCTGGGFALGRAVSGLIARLGSETSGQLDCQGWQTADPNETHRALLRLDWRLTVAYRSQVSG
jgi:hypothetical protein